MNHGDGSHRSIYGMAPALTLGVMLLFAQSALGQAFWGNHGGNPQHTALAPVASQPLRSIVWQTPVDLNPQYSGEYLLIHYGSPLVTQANTVLVPVKTGASDGFRVEAHNGANGALMWSFNSDYSLPSHGWTPSYQPAITPNGRLYLAGAGGTVYSRDNLDSPIPGAITQIAFYGMANYNADKTTYDAAIKICTPLTSDANGNVYFGYRVAATNPLALVSGIARIGADGSAHYASASTISNGESSRIVMNCAPALSNNGNILYIATSSDNSAGYLVAVNAATLAPVAKVRLKDPQNNNDALLFDDGTSSPMIAPDGSVFYGVLENPLRTYRGWMLQFDAALSQTKTPGAFGWDNTPSVVPAAMVPSYQGTSAYLIMTKYNNYAGAGGDGVNKLAILDPNAAQIDPRTNAVVMREVLTIAGITPDDEYLANFPNAVREWCINTAVVDPATNSVLANCEDGKLFRWDLTTNTFTEQIAITTGLGQAYTPTIIGRDGKVYSVNNATLFAVGLPNVTVSGTVTLQGCANAVQPLAFTLRTEFGTEFTRNAALTQTGAYNLTDIPAGTYTLSVKGAKWLRQNVSLPAWSDTANVNLQLRAGDANNDNFADFADLLVLLNAYNQIVPSAGYHEAADFTCDGANDIADLSLIIANYNQQGDS